MNRRRLLCASLLVAAASSPAAGQTASPHGFAARVLNGAESMPKEKFDRGRESDRWSREVYRIEQLQHRVIDPDSPSSPLVGEVTGRIRSANACCFESKAEAAVSVPSPAQAALIHDFRLRFEFGDTGWHLVSGTISQRLANGTAIGTRELVGRAIQRGQVRASDGPVGLLAAYIEGS